MPQNVAADIAFGFANTIGSIMPVEQKAISDFMVALGEGLWKHFPRGVVPELEDTCKIVFRGPADMESDQDLRIVGHVAIAVEPQAAERVSRSTAIEREEMLRLALRNLSSQVMSRYDPKNIGAFALQLSLVDAVFT